MSNTLTVNRKYKDSVFRMLFNSKEELLSLYNAVNGTNYVNTDDLEINTLEEDVYMKMKNDISFIFGFELNLYEHQSTECGNMPLRFLIYVTKIISGMIVRDDLYKKQVIKIPAPRFVVFYNGTDMNEDKVTYRLSDQYEKVLQSPELELLVTVININENHNPDILHACKALNDYAVFVAKIRAYAKIMVIEDAVQKAIDECIAEGIIEGFLMKHRAEVQEMSVFEYNEELHLQNVRQDGIDEATAKAAVIIAEKDAIIAEKDSAIAEKDSTIAKDAETIADLKAKIANLEAQLVSAK
ncbi:hypothetical protein [Butyrivibrio sp. XPD2002]|uniref:hypothetical protein n=1 Tax=Butyrivibrio sp. XPD2002 TaxID=1280665 RepID=UPI0003F87B1C|nr:hypothetical protein [Butyrivibrio sp. XPD2002]